MMPTSRIPFGISGHMCSLMCQYLYAAFSLKTAADGLSPEQVERVERNQLGENLERVVNHGQETVLVAARVQPVNRRGKHEGAG